MADTPKVAAELDLLVLEYLMHTGCDGPAAALKQHLRERANTPLAWRPVGDQVRSRVYDQAMRAFDAGQSDELFAVWEAYVPPLLRMHDRTCQKLEFYLHIYFAVFPVHTNNPQRDPGGLAASMEAFKRYIETNGATLSATAEFLAYYALPYVPQLQEHPAFSALLTASWAAALRQRVSDFLRATPQVASEPRLLALYRNYGDVSLQDDTAGGGAHPGGGATADPVARATADLAAIKGRLLQSEVRLVEAKQLAAKREKVLQRTAHDMYRVAAEQHARLVQTGAATPAATEHRAALRRAAESLTALGQAPAPLPSPDSGGGVPAVPNTSRKSQFASPRGPAGGTGPGGSGGIADFGGAGLYAGGGCVGPAGPDVGDAPVATPMVGEAALPRRPPDARPRSVPLFAALNYGAVIADLQRLDGPDRALVLQALRWRLVKSTGRQRHGVLATYVQNDLLQAAVVDAALESGDALIVEQLLRLLNHFASFAAGRAYILGKDGLLEKLCRLMLSDKSDTATRQNVLGALQKLSLRRGPQAAMVEGGVIDWLATVLTDTDALSEYTIEYATALLMNLSLRLAGKRRCEDPAVDILGALNHLLEYDDPQVRTYVNGTLYSVLTRPAIRNRALEMGLPDILEALLAHSDQVNARQIQYILPLLAADAPDPDQEAEEAAEAAEEEEDDYDDDDDDEEPEEDGETDIPRGATTPYGEELLASRYIASVYEAQAEASELERTAPPPRLSPNSKLQASSRRKVSALQDEPLQRPITPNTTAKGGPPPPHTQYPVVDDPEDVEATFASRNKLARTPAPGAFSGGLGDPDLGIHPSPPRTWMLPRPPVEGRRQLAKSSPARDGKKGGNAKAGRQDAPSGGDGGCKAVSSSGSSPRRARQPDVKSRPPVPTPAAAPGMGNHAPASEQGADTLPPEARQEAEPMPPEARQEAEPSPRPDEAAEPAPYTEDAGPEDSGDAAGRGGEGDARLVEP